MMEDLGRMGAQGVGYAVQQGTRPQTLGYALPDSPVGQAAWIYEKLVAWSDNEGYPDGVLSKDEVLHNIMLYCVTNSATSAARFYWDNHGEAVLGIKVEVPAGATIFPREIYRAPRSWSDMYLKNIVYWNEAARGGHFAAFKQPQIFVEEMRACFRSVR